MWLLVYVCHQHNTKKLMRGRPNFIFSIFLYDMEILLETLCMDRTYSLRNALRHSNTLLYTGAHIKYIGSRWRVKSISFIYLYLQTSYRSAVEIKWALSEFLTRLLWELRQKKPLCYWQELVNESNAENNKYFFF